MSLSNIALWTSRSTRKIRAKKIFFCFEFLKFSLFLSPIVLISSLNAQSFTVTPPSNIEFQYTLGFERVTLTWDRHDVNCDSIEIYYSQNRQELEERRGYHENASCYPNELEITGLTTGTWYFALAHMSWEVVCYIYDGEEECEDQTFESELSEIVSFDINVNMTVLADFESGGLGKFDEEDGYSWNVRSGATPSSKTGPARAKQGDYYAYMETSACCYNSSGDTLSLTVVDIDDSVNHYLLFNYNMYGANIGTLRVETFVGSSWQAVWSKTGQQGGAYTWREELIPINSAREIRLVAVAAGGYLGDIALDNIRLITPTLAVTYIHTDLLGTPVAESDENGNIQD